MFQQKKHFWRNDLRNYPAYIYVQKLPIKRVHLYTFVQVICYLEDVGCLRDDDDDDDFDDFVDDDV